MGTNLERRATVAVLWVAHSVINLAQIAISFFNPDFLRGVMEGRAGSLAVTDAQVLAFTFSLAGPALLAYAVLAIPNPKANKWLNVAFAAIIGLMSWVDFFAQAGHMGSSLLVGFLTSVPPTIAIFYAWQLGREERPA